MKDSQGNVVLGRTKWLRFAAVVVPAAIAVTGLMAGVANGSVRIQMNVSGQTAKISADKLVATGFSQYGGYVTTADGKVIPVAASAIKHADIYNLCQSVKVPGTPLALIIRAGQDPDHPVVGTDMLMGMDYLNGDAVFTNIDIGQDASKITKGGAFVGSAGDFAQEADSAVITNVKQRIYSTHAGTFSLAGMTLSLQANKECFADPVIN
jgi:hypothetical protein